MASVGCCALGYDSRDPNKPKKLKVCAGYTVASVLVFFFCLSVIPGSPLKPGLLAWLSWLNQLPLAWGALLFAIAQTLAIICALPATPFNLAAGYIFAAWLGSLVSLASLYAAAIASFLIGRFLARSWAESMIEKRPSFKVCDAT